MEDFTESEGRRRLGRIQLQIPIEHAETVERMLSRAEKRMDGHAAEEMNLAHADFSASFDPDEPGFRAISAAHVGDLERARDVLEADGALTEDERRFFTSAQFEARVRIEMERDAPTEAEVLNALDAIGKSVLDFNADRAVEVSLGYGDGFADVEAFSEDVRSPIATSGRTLGRHPISARVEYDNGPDKERAINVVAAKLDVEPTYGAIADVDEQSRLYEEELALTRMGFRDAAARMASDLVEQAKAEPEAPAPGM